MAVRPQVDVELLTIRYLRTVPDVTALVGTRLSTELPPTPTWPYLTVFRIGGLADYPGWVDAARLQVDAWAANKAAASLLARTALAALLNMPGTYDLGVVSYVAQDLGLTWAPDETTDQPRYVFGVAVYTHPPHA